MKSKHIVPYEIKILLYSIFLAIPINYFLSRLKIEPITTKIGVFLLPVAIIFSIIRNYNKEKIIDFWIKIKLFFSQDIMKPKEPSENIVKEDENSCYYEFKNKNYIVKYQRAKKDYKTEHGVAIHKNSIEFPSLIFKKISLNNLFSQLLKMAEDLHNDLKLGSPYPFEYFVDIPAPDASDAMEGGANYDSKEKFMESFKNEYCPYYNSTDSNIIGIVYFWFRRFRFIIYQKDRIKTITIKGEKMEVDGTILYECNKRNPLYGFNKKKDFIVNFDDNTKFKFGTREKRVYFARILHYFIYEQSFSLE